MVNNEVKLNGATEQAPTEQTVAISSLTTLTSADENIVHAVLTLPGIVGLAFLDQTIPLQSPLQVYGWDAGLEIRRSGVFVASVTQVLRSMPTEFYQLEFGFGSYRALLRRFGTGDAMALVRQAGKDWMDEEPQLAAFCRVAMESRSAVLLMIEAHQQRILETGVADDVPRVDRSVFLAAFNRLTEIAGRYLGATIAVRHLSRSQPMVDCLTGVTIDRSGRIVMNPSTLDPALDSLMLTPDQRLAFLVWIEEFVKQCSKIIRNFDVLAQKEGLTEEEYKLLFDPAP